MKLLDQARRLEGTPLLSLLLAGSAGCGKTAMSAHLARLSDFPFARRIASENYAGCSEQEKIARITQVFDDAQKSPLSIVILDDLELLMDYTCIGPRFSNAILQTFFGLLKRRPSKPGHRMLIVATTSELNFMKTSKLLRAFNVALELPLLSESSHFKAALQGLPGFTVDVIEEVCAGLCQPVGIRTLLQVVEMATFQTDSVDAKYLLECFLDAGVFDTPDF